MKAFLLTLLLLVSSIVANATDVGVAGTTISQIPFNPSNIGSDRTITVTVVNGSPTVTSSAAFPSNIVGIGGFTVTIGGVQYTVAFVSSTSSLTLTSNYAASGGSASMILYKYVLMRAYATQAFQTNTSTTTTATATATSASTTVTSSAAFPSALVGAVGGFSVLINGVQYTSAILTSTSSMTLATPYAGSTGSVTVSFNAVAENVQAGTPGSGFYFKQWACSIRNPGFGNLLYVPSFILPATTDSPTNNQAQYVLGYYRPDGSSLGTYTCGQVSQLAIPATTPTTLAAICTYNAPGAIVPPNTEAYSKPQIDARFPACTSGQSYYFASDGQQVACLNFGSGLSLSGNTLTAAGGGGGVNPGTAGQGAYYAGTGSTVSPFTYNSSYFAFSGANLSPKGLEEAINVKTDYGCVGDGVTNDTTCVSNALTAASAATGKKLYFPAGTYLTDGFTTTTNSLIIQGDGPGKSIIKSNNNAALMTFNNASVVTHSITIRDLSLVGFGSGASNHGIYFTGANEPFDITIQNVRLNNFFGTGIYAAGPGSLFTSRLEDVDIDMPSGASGHAIDLLGAQTNTIIRTYVHNVATSKVAYRLRQGSWTLIGVNGIDSGSTAGWGIFGQQTSDDGTDTYAQITMIGCNIEDWSATDGLIFRIGSIGSFYNTKWDTLGSGTYRAVKFNYLDVGYSGIFDAESGFLLNGTAAWTNSLPVHSYNPPFIQIGSNEITSYYDTNIGAAVSMSAIKNNLNVGNTRATTDITRLSLGTSSGQGMDGNFLFASNNVYNIGNSGFTASPANVYVATSILMANGTTTVGGQNWTITGGSNPQYAFSDGTVSGRVQLLGASYMQLGTTSAHQLLFLTNGTGRWAINSSGHFIVDSGSLTIGLAAGNRPTIVYASTSLNAGTPGVSTGSLVFGNSTNSNTLTIQSGVTSSSITYTLPTADGSSGQCLKTNGSGVLSFSACASSGASLTATQVGFGDGSNLLSGSSEFTYNSTTRVLTLTRSGGAVAIAMTGTTDSNQIRMGSGAHPGTGQGLILPFVGTGQSTANGITWSDGTYANTSSIWLNFGYNFQGASSAHDLIKFRTGTGTSSDGSIRFQFEPSQSLFTQTGSVGNTNTAYDGQVVDFASTGTAAAGFGFSNLVKLENGSGSQVNASRITTTWTTATAGSETSKVAIATNVAGGGVADSFAVEGDQYYGNSFSGNISGAVTMDCANGNVQFLTLTNNVTSFAASNMKAGAIYFVYLLQGGTARTMNITSSSTVKFSGGAFVITAGTNTRDQLICASDGSALYCGNINDIK